MTNKSLRFLLASCAVLGLAQSTHAGQPPVGLPPLPTWEMEGQINFFPGGTVGLFSSDDFGNNTVPVIVIENDLSIGLPGNINGSPTDGSVVGVEFAPPAGGKVTIAYQLVTNEDIGSGYDRAFIYLDGNQQALGNDSLANSLGLSTKNKNVAGAAAATPVTVLTITGLTPGTHELAFGVYDTEDTDVSSGVLLSLQLPDLQTALSVAVEQREVILGAVQASTQDVGGRLFALRTEADDDDNGVTTLALVDGGKSTRDGKDAKDSKEIKVAPARPTVEFYGQGDFGYQDRNDVSLADFVSHTYVGTAGVEVHLNKHLTLGLAYSHIENRTDFGNMIGKLRLRGDAITPYVSYAQNHFYGEALYSYSKFDDAVNINGAGSGTPASENHTVDINIGYNLNYGRVVTGPFAAMNYTTGGLDSYTSTGLTPVSFGKQSYDSLITRLGWQASYKLPTHFGSVTPQISASWDRENLDSGDTVSAGLPGVQTATLNAGTGVITPTGIFTQSANTIQQNRDYLNVGGGVLVNINDRGSVVVGYEEHFFRSSFSERFATLKFGIKF